MALWPRATSDQLTEEQLRAIVVIERIGSSLSLLGCAFIMASFLLSKAFHRPINRLVFYASIGNCMTNFATIIARVPILNIDGFLCQFQAFLIQMFMPADAYWTLAMAFNVYLTFYWKFDAARLRRIEPLYIALCYGVPFIPAFVFIFIKTRENGRFYGNAVLWCWVANDWDVWRILTFYGPVWFVIVLTIAIYLRAGVEIYRRRKQLRDFKSTQLTDLSADRDFMSIKTTEVSVTSERINPSFDTLDLHQLDRAPPGKYPRRSAPRAPKGNVAYSVSISSHQSTPPPFPQKEFENDAADMDPNTHLRPPTAVESFVSTPNSFKSPMSDHKFAERPTPQLTPPTPGRRIALEANTAAWGYTKVALLFFTAMLVTWMPSSANRLYSLVHPGQISIPLEFASALVLPLQGFWNAVIYIMTSWAGCKTAWRQLFGSSRQGSSDVNKNTMQVFRTDSKDSSLGSSSLSSESMTELTPRSQL